MLVNQTGVRKKEMHFGFHDSKSDRHMVSSIDYPNWIWLIAKKYMSQSVRFMQN